MPWVRFTARFDFQVKTKPHVVISYKAGSVMLVKQRCFDEALSAGKAVAVERRKATDATDDAAGR